MSDFVQAEGAQAAPVYRRLGLTAFLLLLSLMGISCGDVYRPVATIVPVPPPDPAAFHFVMSLSTNGIDTLNPQTGLCTPSGATPPCVGDRGSMSRIDVSGDSNVGVFTTGVHPTHAAVLLSG